MLRLCRWQETVHELYRTCRELGGAGQIQHVGESGGGLAIGAGAVWSGTVNVFRLLSYSTVTSSQFTALSPTFRMQVSNPSPPSMKSTMVVSIRQR